jgi:hypothetical protein
MRDALDARIVHETRTDTATVSSPGGSATYGLHQGIIDSQADVGGWPTYHPGVAPLDTDHDGMPDAWEARHSLSATNAADRNSLASSDYTQLEEYLNSLASRAH